MKPYSTFVTFSESIVVVQLNTYMAQHFCNTVKLNLCSDRKYIDYGMKTSSFQAQERCKRCYRDEVVASSQSPL
jgi:hypothetical protein